MHRFVFRGSDFGSKYITIHFMFHIKSKLKMIRSLLNLLKKEIKQNKGEGIQGNTINNIMFQKPQTQELKTCEPSNHKTKETEAMC